MKYAQKTAVNLSQMNFQDMMLAKSELSRGTLIKTDFSRAILWDARFNDADLRQAVLNDADLRNTRFVRSNLREADLNGADLEGADINRADLTGAILSNANLTNANIRWCKLAGAKLADANLTRVDMENATGYTAAQLGAALSLYGTMGIDRVIEGELRRIRPQLFDPPPGAMQAEYKAGDSPGVMRAIVRSIASLFRRLTSSA